MFRTRRTKVNRIVLTLVYTNLIFYLAVGLLSPVIAIYYAGEINGGSVALAGFVTALFWLVKSATQVPVAMYADKIRGEGDDYFMMVAGYVVIAIVPLMYYLFVSEVWQVYLLEAIRGVGYGLCTPTFLAIFTRHIDINKENFEWTLHSNAVGLAFAAAAAVGGVLAQYMGFRSVFLLTSAMMFLSPITLLLIRHEMTTGKHSHFIDGAMSLSHDSNLKH